MKRFMIGLARVMAVLGGVVLVALIAITCLSILGRMANTLAHSAWLASLAPALADGLKATGIGPVTGDFELVEAGIAFAIFAFLPWCQLVQGHATVDLFTNGLSARNNRALMLLWEVILAAAMVLIAWRLYAGMTDKMRYGETTFLLQFPVWWAYLASFIACAIAAATALYAVWLRLQELTTGERHFTLGGGAGH